MVEHQHTYNTIQYRLEAQQVENIFQKSTNQQQELPVVDMFVNGSGRNEQSLQRAFHSCYLSSFGSFGQAVSELKIFQESTISNTNCLCWPCLLTDPNEQSLQRAFHRCYLPRFGSFGRQAVSEQKICWESTNQQHELPVLAMFVNGSKMSNIYRGPSIDATYHVSVHLAKPFSEQKIFLESTNQQHELPVLAMFVNGSKMSNLYRGPSIDATYHVSVHLPMRFQSRRFFRNRPISNNNCMCRPCLLRDQD